MIRILVCCLLAAGPATADCILGGTVVDGVSGKPLPGTRVFAKPRKPAAPAILRVADAAGAFCFERLDAGDYEVVAARTGYLTTFQGGRPGDRSGKLYVVAPGTRIPALLVRMLQAATLSGTVIDAAGRLLPGFQISLWRKAWHGGAGWVTERAGNAIADDRGVFRFASLAPGVYYVRGDVPREQNLYRDENGQPARPANVRTYYPSALAWEQATPVTLAPGQDAAGMTIAMVQAVPRRISGNVAGVTWVAGAHPLVRLVADQETVTFIQETPVRPDGSFAAENLYPAKYSVATVAASRYIVKNIDVTAADADGIVLAPDPPRVDLRISLETNGEPNPRQLFAVDLHTGRFVPVPKNPRGAYNVPALEAGRYLLKTEGGPSYIHHLIVDGRARPDAVLDLQPGSTLEVRAVLAPANARIEAHVAQLPNSLAVTLVWLDLSEGVPYPEGKHDAVPSGGVLEVPSLAPGKYRLFGIEGFDRAPWGCPDLTAALTPKSVEVELKPGETRTVDVPVISSAEWDAALRKLGL
jgi:hypothetical protein